MSESHEKAPSAVRVLPFHGPILRREIPDTVLRDGADEGNPKVGVDTFKTLSSGRAVGIWTSTEGAWPIESKPETELFFVLEGRLRLVEDDGEAIEFGPGDAGLVHRGWRGRWEVMEEARKLWATLD